MFWTGCPFSRSSSLSLSSSYFLLECLCVLVMKGPKFNTELCFEGSNNPRNCFFHPNPNVECKVNCQDGITDVSVELDVQWKQMGDSGLVRPARLWGMHSAWPCLKELQPALCGHCTKSFI